VAYKWQCLIAVCVGSFLATMDVSIVNVALPTLAREFNEAPNTVVWATLTSSLVVTGLTLTAGRVGDLYGRKRLYVAGWIIFTSGMAVAGLAQNIEQLIAFRFFQAVGAALALGCGNALVTEAFPDSERGTALGTTGAVVGAGLMSGPIFGGLILGAFNWQAIFYLRVPIGLLAMALAVFLIRPSEAVAQSGSRKIDVPGAVALFLTLSSAILAVNRGQSWGWTSPVILGLFVVAAGALSAFIRIEARSASPVIALSLFRIRNFSVSALSLVLSFSGQAAVTFLMPFYLIKVKGYSTVHTGFILATVPCMMLLLSSFSGRVSDRHGHRHQVTLGMAIACLGLVSLATLQASTTTPMIVARLAIVGIGTAIFMSPNSSEIMGAVPRHMLGTASAAVATSRNIGNATGLAMASAILVAVGTASAGFSASRTDALPPDALLHGVRVAFLVAAAVSSTAIVASTFRGRRPEPVITPVALASAAPSPQTGD
jgi:EmrB/QacA subfamily drug resistance transporter